MASIRVRPRKDSSPQFTVLWRDPDTKKQRSMQFVVAHEADNFKRLIEATGGQLDPARQMLQTINKRAPSVITVVERHITTLPSITARTRADYLSEARRHIFPILGTVSIEQLSAAHIKNWLLTLADSDMSDKSIANCHGLLSSAMTTAVSEELRPDNPCRGIRLPRRSEHESVEMIFLTDKQWAALDIELGKVCSGQYQILFQFLAGTGCRWGEAVALRVTDLSLDTHPPTVRISRASRRDENGKAYVGPTKTKRSRRTIALPAALTARLRGHVKGKASSDLVFTSPTGAPTHHSNVRTRAWLPAIAAAQDIDAYGSAALADVPRIHDLRHSHASWLLAAGLDLLTVQRRLGHESITTTADRYGHVMPAQQNAAAAALDSVFG